MIDDIFISLQNLISKRWAVFEDDGISAWLYLTEPNSEKPIADCWIYNRIPISPTEDMGKFEIPLPAISSVTDNDAVYHSIDKEKLSFLWSKNGESVSLFYANVSLGFIHEANQRGYSYHLIEDCTWGNVFDYRLFRRTFLDFIMSCGN